MDRLRLAAEAEGYMVFRAAREDARLEQLGRVNGTGYAWWMTRHPRLGCNIIASDQRWRARTEHESPLFMQALREFNADRTGRRPGKRPPVLREPVRHRCAFCNGAGSHSGTSGIRRCVACDGWGWVPVP